MSSSVQCLKGKRALIVGVANERSLAWAIARELHAAGASLAFTFLNQALERRVRPLAESLNAELIEPCDVAQDTEMDRLFTAINKKWDSLDILIHAVAFANREDQ